MKKKIPKGIKKHIRIKKSQIRKQSFTEEKKEKMVEELYQKMLKLKENENKTLSIN